MLHNTSMSSDLLTFATPDSLELLAMFENAASEAQAAWLEAETDEDRFESAVRKHTADEFFSNLAK